MNSRISITLAVMVAVSGCVSSSEVDQKPDYNLEEIVVSEDEIPVGFELAQQNVFNASDFTNKSANERVSKKYIRPSTNRTAVVLSWATVYESEKAAEEVNQDFLNKTVRRGLGSALYESEKKQELYPDGTEVTNLKTLSSNVERNHYIHRRNGSLVYFIGVHDFVRPEILAENLFEDMKRAE